MAHATANCSFAHVTMSRFVDELRFMRDSIMFKVPSGSDVPS